MTDAATTGRCRPSPARVPRQSRRGPGAGRDPRLRLLRALCLPLALSAALSADASASRKRIVFGSDHDFPPYEFLDERGRPAGFNVDLVRAIGEVMDLEVTVRLGPWHEIRQGLEVEGIIDVSDMYFSAARAERVEFSEPFAIAHDEVFVRVDAPEVCSFQDLAGREVIVQRGTYTQDYLERNAPDAVLIPEESEPAALRLLASGEHDCAVVTQVTGRHAIRRHGLTNLTSAGPPVLPRDHCLVVAKGRQDLLEVLNQGLAILKATGRFSEIYQRWLYPREGRDATVGEVARGAAWVLAPLLLLVGASLAWNRSLQRQVRARTRDLRAELAERRRAEQALGDSETRFRFLVEHTPAVTYTATLDGPVSPSYVSPQLEALLGYGPDEWTADPELWGDRILPEDRHLVQGELARCVATGEPFRCTYRMRSRSGAVVWVRDQAELVRDEAGTPRLLQGVMVDVTRQKHLEQEFLQAQKMESVGRLAGGVAHDFNNLLTAIVGNAELAERSLPPDHPARARMAELLQAADRGAGLTRQLLAFSRRQVIAPQVVDLNQLIRGAEDMLRRLLGEDVELATRLDPAPSPVRIDPGQAEQVLLNLAVNARDAMPGGGTLSVTTRDTELAGEEVGGQEPLRPGPFVELTVRDTGAGMAPEVLAHIFEPFFTTKETGKGTGLGLATCYGIVRQAGGLIRVRSSPGQGAEFRVLLPRATEYAEQGSSPAPRQPLPRGRETILLVEDDDQVREIARQTLLDLGYAVLAAADGEEAVKKAVAHPETIDLLLTDVVMPRMAGPEVARRLRLVRPTTRVLFMSGHAPDAVLRQGVSDARRALLAKPFTRATLARRVREVLDGANDAPEP